MIRIDGVQRMSTVQISARIDPALKAAMRGLFAALRELLPTGCVVTDVGSSKGSGTDTA